MLNQLACIRLAQGSAQIPEINALLSEMDCSLHGAPRHRGYTAVLRLEQAGKIRPYKLQSEQQVPYGHARVTCCLALDKSLPGPAAEQVTLGECSPPC